MMRRLFSIIVATVLVFSGIAPTLAANYAATAGSGLTFGALSFGSAPAVLYPYFIGCDATTPTQCWAVDASGHLTVNIASGQTIAVTNAGTFATQATLQASATTAIGKVDPNTLASWGLMAGIVPGTAPSNAVIVGCIYNASAPTATTGQTLPFQCTAAGSQHVTVDNSNNNGQAPSTNSSPVVTASDQKVSTANSSVPINISTATTTQLVALSGTTKIYVTHWDVIAAGTGNITLEYGTGTTCGTGTTALTGAYNLTAQAGISVGTGVAPVLIVPAGNALCALTSAAVQMSGAVTYQQF